MKECNFTKLFDGVFTLFYLVFLLILLVFTPFSQTEANILFSQHETIESFLVKNIYNYFQTYWSIRLPFFILSLFSLYFYRDILKSYFKENDKYYTLSYLIFILVPGVTLTFVIVNYATIPILLTLIIVYASKNENNIVLILAMVLLLFTHSAQFVVYLGVAFYGYSNRNWRLTIVSVGFVLMASLLSTYDIDGIPKGHLIQLVGIYATIFSPILFLVFVYSIYRIAIKGKKEILWYIVVSAFTVSILLSIRQAIKITDFTPFIVISIPLIVTVFRDSLTIRLKEFRKIYYIICNIVLLVLLLETSVIFLHYPLYKLTPFKELLLDTSMYEIPQRVQELKSSGKVCKDEISTRDISLYRYYGIRKCP